MMSARIPDAYAEFQDPSSPAFNFTPGIIAPQWSPGPTTIGSTYGVPPADYIAGMEPPAGTTSATAFASNVNQRGAASHPIFWAIVIFMAGIILLGFVAHTEAKRRG